MSPRKADSRQRHQIYRRALRTLERASVPFLVGGAFALRHYTGINRDTKDFDMFVRPKDCEPALLALRRSGFRTDLAFPHWLGKAVKGRTFIDVIFNSGNGVCEVDDAWFAHSGSGTLWEVPIRFCAPEDMIWSKAFVMERERYDGADIAHLLRACAEDLDWPRLLDRFGCHWRVLLSHLILFGYVYPAERSRIPEQVLGTLTARLQAETGETLDQALCCGTLLSRAEYCVDVQAWGYRDARLPPGGNLSHDEIARWTAAAEKTPRVA